MPDKTVLLLPQCNDVHTYTMRHPLDIAFIDGKGQVVEAHRFVFPKARLRNKGACMTVERFARPAPWFAAGDRVFEAES